MEIVPLPLPTPINSEVEEEKEEESQKDEDGITECHICYENYNKKERKPLTSKCGHTLCRECATNIICSSQKCPFC